ncbi:hypothetical protein SARC_00549 [Sphaeroforma arctica JP610]|uniref:Uncharacterized protein n=1 Tax=Sphaeroforma arctica JP610 TaxID=667725 RepID=A0A0L0GEP4_9EUKA|nr:hypothetical protein SARC_00549 [Sphaeroforma arctica JP610]KNC87359.1 hypothetical protein SARC_00549 [Sphaeroforma arctica JP610]|eukprot:XP_014161261.1 hypothetical protein SARC_00549 [Sphaeroforma arctica JP610]
MSCKRGGSVQVERHFQHDDSSSDEEEVCTAEQIAKRKIAVTARSTKLLDRVQRLRELDIKHRTDPSELDSESDFTTSSILTARLGGTLSLSPEPKSCASDHNPPSRPTASTDTPLSKLTGQGIKIPAHSGVAQLPAHSQPQPRMKSAPFIYNGRCVHGSASATSSPTIGRSAPSSLLSGRSSASSPLIGRCRTSSSLPALKKRSNLSPCITNNAEDLEHRARVDHATEESYTSNLSATSKKQKKCTSEDICNGLSGHKVPDESCAAISTVSLGGLPNIQPLRNIPSYEG